MNNEILPLPWRVIKDYANASNKADIWTSGHGSTMVAECRTGGMRDYLQMQATADFIVMACNSHHDLKDLNAELLEALKKALSFMQFVHNDPNNCFCGDNADEFENEVLPLAKTAIQKAEGSNVTPAPHVVPPSYEDYAEESERRTFSAMQGGRED